MKTRVQWSAGEHAGIRDGVVESYAHVGEGHDPNIFAIVIDDKTQVFCAVPIWKLKRVTSPEG